jgi:hypothetical protein
LAYSIPNISDLHLDRAIGGRVKVDFAAGVVEGGGGDDVLAKERDIENIVESDESGAVVDLEMDGADMCGG